MSAVFVGVCIVIAGALVGGAIGRLGKSIVQAIAQRGRQWP